MYTFDLTPPHKDRGDTAHLQPPAVHTSAHPGAHARTNTHMYTRVHTQKGMRVIKL